MKIFLFILKLLPMKIMINYKYFYNSIHLFLLFCLVYFNLIYALIYGRRYKDLITSSNK